MKLIKSDEGIRQGRPIHLKFIAYTKNIIAAKILYFLTCLVIVCKWRLDQTVLLECVCIEAWWNIVKRIKTFKIVIHCKNEMAQGEPARQETQTSELKA